MPENESYPLDQSVEDMEVLISDQEAELEALRRQEEELNRKKIELMDRQRASMKLKAELAEKKRREEEAKQEIDVRVCDFNNFIVNVKVLPTIRSDVLAVLRSIHGRSFDGYSGTNRLPIDQWQTTKEQLLRLPNVKISHALGVGAKLQAFLEAPEFLIELKGRSLQVTPHINATTHRLNGIPGTTFDSEKRRYQIPLSEGWRLFDILEGYSRNGSTRKIIWEPQALKLVEEEVERRAKLDTVALKSDSDIDVRLENGNTLRPFQKVGVEFIDLANGRALVADQMGLGKTWEAIAYAILRNLRTVVVCPAHLKANWSREILALTGQAPVILFGREPKPYDMKTLLLDKPQFAVINYDILSAKTMTEEEQYKDEQGRVHVRPPMARYLWADLINSSKPDLIIADEAHYIKNTEANRSKAVRLLQPERRLPMTGTPVLNRPGEYWAVLNWIRPELFPSEDRFLNQYTVNGKQAKNVDELRDLLKTIMIRRLKKDVVEELPPINRITQLHELSDTARAQYQKVLQGVYNAIDAAGNQIQKNVTNILVEIGKLKEVCAHDTVDRTADLAMELRASEQDEDDAKMGNNKVLIFSQYKDVVRKIAMKLGKQAIYWTGDTPFEERTRLENEFQTNPDVHYLVVSLMTGQTGLNLTAAGHIIFNDLYWTPAAHAQAEERAYGRLSNLHGADSYYIVAVQTIAEWIQELLQRKLQVINQVVEGIEAERDPAIGMAIIERLQLARGR